MNKRVYNLIIHQIPFSTAKADHFGLISSKLSGIVCHVWKGFKLRLRLVFRWDQSITLPILVWFLC